MPFVPPGVRAKRNKPRATCAFCLRKLKKPKQRDDVFSGDGAKGGRCACGASYVLDETGRSGGQALLDAMALVCEGDLGRAMKLESNVDYEAKSEIYKGRRTTARDVPPKGWCGRLTDATGEPTESDPTAD